MQLRRNPETLFRTPALTSLESLAADVERRSLEQRVDRYMAIRREALRLVSEPVDWDQRYAAFCASKGWPRMDLIVDTRECALAMLGKSKAEFAELYPDLDEENTQ